MKREWLNIGAAYWVPYQTRIEAEIAGLTWKAVPEDGELSLPMSPGLGIQACITELELPKVSAVAHNGYIQVPDGPETAHYSIYGIEANYKDGRARVYVIDAGTQLVPIAVDFEPTAVPA